MSRPAVIHNQLFFPIESALQPEGLLHSRGIAGSGFPPLSKIPHCCLPLESGPCLSPSVADRPLRPATDRCLGRPLPYQLANPTWAHPIARGLAIPRFPPKGVCGISPAIAGLSPTNGQIPTYYSPVRHSSAPEGLLPFDLHVLGMPPAFNLSQDQTLQLMTFGCFIGNQSCLSSPSCEESLGFACKL